ncbi:DUF2955 domain-containing protein [Methylobacterium sp.]|uniref:DUF2955 domain-containing protein n=1 Tax=Methylobacterium sp. TaxID=409 RepID=UPI00261B4BB4|nr:DUF2955 domain-containing protein [Methylobacterium sp.]MDB5645946.1 hypothetical protein [Methylobacterium sp.]
MSTDPARDVGPAGARRAALRLAFGATACFGLVEARGWDATFLVPLLTAQMLVKLRQPPTLRQGVGLLVAIALSTGLVLAVTASFIGHPAVLILALALLLYLSFYAHRRAAPDLVTLLIQIAAVSLPVLAVAAPDAATGFAATLLCAGTVALLTVWLAFAAFPGGGPESGAPPIGASAPPDAARGALLDTLVLLPVLTGFILVATELAVVVLIVIVTLLRQHDPETGRRAALGLILGNLIGGVAAAVAYDLILMNDTLPFFVLVCLAATLMFAGRIAGAGARAPVNAIALATFILLLGLGMSPLPGGSGEAFAARLVNVLMASAYAIGAVSLLGSRRGGSLRLTPGRTRAP